MCGRRQNFKEVISMVRSRFPIRGSKHAWTNCRQIGGFSSIAARANGPPWPLRSCAPRALMPCMSMEYARNASALPRRRASPTKWRARSVHSHSRPSRADDAKRFPFSLTFTDLFSGKSPRLRREVGHLLAGPPPRTNPDRALLFRCSKRRGLRSEFDEKLLGFAAPLARSRSPAHAVPVRLHVPGGGIVTFIHAEDAFQFSLNGRIGDGPHGFHAIVEVPAHPVRRIEVKLGMSGVLEAVNAGVFEKPAQDTEDPDSWGETRHPGPQAAKAAHAELDGNARPARLVEFANDFRGPAADSL